jgi:hypothetical protein
MTAIPTDELQTILLFCNELISYGVEEQEIKINIKEERDMISELLDYRRQKEDSDITK